ncbi:PYLa/PGLa A-like [Xenopus laevis]|uniref:PYLa/PGLa A-like n=2 Tax=Xenopus laevis TaxID=8355 RepID=A0A1L8FWL6_XENLA|nr:PYLa/PGLa A-like [Xenopus laevis]OCT75966.1 hypothetical protein XELAEV_18031152mg [Xenopus laevis]
MYKEIFLCVFFAAIAAKSMAQPTATENMSERYGRGMASKAGAIAGKLAKVAIKAALGRRNAWDHEDAKRMAPRFTMLPENDRKIKQFLPGKPGR